MDSIGIIHTPFTHLENMPIQPGGASAITGSVTIDDAYISGLQDLDGFSHIYLIYQFHKAARTELVVTPFMDTVSRGVFATRSPLRPNHIGISLVKLLSVNGPVLHIQGVDILDGTPLLDIKPYIPAFDQAQNVQSGWMTATAEEVGTMRSDKRFI